MSPRLERAALPKLLAHPAYRRHAKTEKLGNLASALASLVELENPPPHRDRNGSHGPTLSHNHVSVKLHHLWKCSKSSTEAMNALGKKVNLRQTFTKSGSTAELTEGSKNAKAWQ